MSDPSNVSGGGGANQPARTAKKPRSPVERIIVWGGIIVLLGVVAVEARARKGYEWTLSALEKEIAKDEGADAKPLLVKDIDQHLIGWPNRTESELGSYRKITLTWRGLFQKKPYGIDLTYDSRDHGDGFAVLDLVTHGADEPAAPEPVPEDAGPVEPPGGYGISTAPMAHNAETGGSPAPGGPAGESPGGRGRPEAESTPDESGSPAERPSEPAPADPSAPKEGSEAPDAADKQSEPTPSDPSDPKEGTEAPAAADEAAP